MMRRCSVLWLYYQMKTCAVSLWPGCKRCQHVEWLRRNIGARHVDLGVLVAACCGLVMDRTGSRVLHHQAKPVIDQAHQHTPCCNVCLPLLTISRPSEKTKTPAPLSVCSHTIATTNTPPQKNTHQTL